MSKKYPLIILCLFFSCGCEPVPAPTQPSPRSSQHPKAKGNTPKRKAPAPLASAKIPKEDQPTTYEDPLESVRKSQGMRPLRRKKRGRRIRPVYYERDIPPHPLAVQLCESLHTLAAKRKQACCQERQLGYLLTPECIRTLSIVLQKKTVLLDKARVPSCLKALEKAHKGCAWIGPWTPKTPKPCLGLLQGTRKKGQRCRSSLECQNNLYCRGAGPTNPGHCSAPHVKDTPCGIAPDPLAVYTRQDNTEHDHPLCQGYCRRFRCHDKHPPNSPCKADIQCTTGHYCDGLRCIKGAFAAENQKCSGRCAPSTRCVKGRCIRPKTQGERCSSSLECLGACEVEEGQKIGHCAMQCVHPLLRPRKARTRPSSQPRSPHRSIPSSQPHTPR